MWYTFYWRPVSKKLANKLFEDYKGIYTVSKQLVEVNRGNPWSSIFNYFIGVPCDTLRRLFEYQAFNQVFILYYQNDIETAKKLVSRLREFSTIYWSGGQIETVAKGRLLTM